MAIWHAARDGRPEAERQFWRDEYRLNLKLAEYAKPIVSFMHGITMGGGVGLGCHLSHRIVGESTRLALPEARIGMIPDTGASHLLNRAPGRLGLWIGLTGETIGPGDAIHVGFADHFIPQAAWAVLIQALWGSGDPWAINRAARQPPDSPLAGRRRLIDQVFAVPDADEILARLDRMDTDWARQTAGRIRGNSPISVLATAALISAASRSLSEALAAEYRYTHRAVQPWPTEFLEGVRAQLIDKDRQPIWQTDGVDAAAEVALASLGTEELGLA